MPMFDWLNFLHRTRRALRRDIRIRKREHQNWPSAIVLIEPMEPRVVLAAPTATSSTASVHMNSFLWSAVPVWEPDGNPLTVSLVGASPSGGDLVLFPGGGFHYTPNENFVGTDSFQFQAFDGAESSTIETMTINVTDSAPISTSGSASVHMNSFLWQSFGAYDMEGDPISISVVGLSTSHGSLTLTPYGTFTYLPDLNFVGTDSFQFQAFDGAMSSSVETMTINVTDSAPITASGSASVHMNSFLWQSFGAYDMEGDQISISVVGPSTSHGSLTLTPYGTFTYLPDENFVGTDSFQFQAFDGAMSSSVETMTINVTDSAPIAASGSASVHMNSFLWQSFGAYDMEGDQISISVVGPSTSHGSLTLTSYGTFTYLPDENFVGTDSFQFQAFDGAMSSAIETMTINVTDSAPIAASGSASVHMNSFLWQSFGAYDMEGDQISISVVGPSTSHGSLTLTPYGTFTYLPDENFVGTDSFQFQAFDGAMSSTIETMTINVTDSAPIATSGSANVPMNSLLWQSFGAYDMEGDPITISVVGPSTSHGSLTLTSYGTFSYLPDGNFVGTDSFQFQAFDGAMSSLIETFTINVTGDDDSPPSPGITVSPTAGLLTSETGATATFTVVLDSLPTADVTIGLLPNDLTEGIVSTSSLTFTPGNWNVAQTVTITGVDDLLVDGSITYLIVTAAASSADSAYNGIAAADVTVTNTDNESPPPSPGITVTPTRGLRTSEWGATATFTVVLTTPPTADVTIGLSSNDISEGSVSTGSLTFTSGNWNLAQTVTITGVDDLQVDGSVAYLIVTAAASSADPAYNGINAADVAVANTDNDGPPPPAGITVTPTGGLLTSESGATATFTVVLDSPPTADVTIGLSSSNTEEGTVSPGSLTFSSGNWFVAQTVTITGVNDSLADGNVGYLISTSAASSADPAYNGIDAADVAVTNKDNDGPPPAAGITVSPTEGLRTAEWGATTTFTVILDSPPMADVTIGLSSNDTAEGTVSTGSLIFTPGNWNVAQTVTITGVDDTLVDGSVAYSIVTAAASSADPAYNGINPADVSVINADDDVLSTLAGITVSPTSGLMTSEFGGTATFTVVLDSPPTADVTIGLSSNDLSEGIVSTGSLTFTPGNWNVAQTVTITGVDDLLGDGNIAYLIVTAAASSADFAYNGTNPADVSVTNSDNEFGSETPPGITVTPTSGLVTTESRGTATFTVRLNSQPTDGVTIGLSSSDIGEGAVSPLSLTFTPSNWNIDQTVTVTGEDDSLDDGDMAYMIVTAPAMSTDSGYMSLNAADVFVTNTDDESGVTISIGDVSVAEGDSGTTMLTFTASLSALSSVPVTVDYATADGTALSINDYISTTGTLTFGVGDTTATFSVTINGDTTVEPHETFFVNLSAPTNATIADNQGIGTITTDDVIINAGGQPPSLTIGDVSVSEGNSGTKTATFYVTLLNPPVTTVTVQWATADGTATNANVDYIVASGTLNFTPPQPSLPIIITINGDTTVESDETFFVNLSSAINATISDPQGEGTITNDDSGGGGTPALSINNVTVTEGNSGITTATFKVTLSSTPTNIVTVQWATADGSATDAESDYDAASGTLTFGVGDTTEDVIITINGDTTGESDENFFVDLSFASNATISDGQGEATITNDDSSGGGVPIVNVEIDKSDGRDDSTSELTGLIPDSVKYKFTQSFVTPNPLRIYYDLDDSTASTDDYNTNLDVDATDGFWIEIPPGQLSVMKEMTARPDSTIESPETLVVTLVDDLTYDFLASLTGPKAKGTIVDPMGVKTTVIIDDTSRTMTFEGKTLDLTFRRPASQKANKLVVELEIDWTILTYPDADIPFGRSASESDFVETATEGDPKYNVNFKRIFRDKQFTFAAGEESKTFTFRVKDDSHITAGAEGLEGFTIGIKSTSTVQSFRWDYLLDRPVFAERGRYGGEKVVCYFGDMPVLYATQNTNTDLADAIPAGDPNPGIYWNDSNQGGVRACFVMAALSAVARVDWRIIKNAIEQPDPANPFQYKVSLFVNGVRTKINVTLDPKWGMASAEFSGDYKPIAGQNVHGVEVWPQVIEQALADPSVMGRNGVSMGGGVGGPFNEVLRALRGQIESVSAGATISAQIRNTWNEPGGRGVVIATTSIPSRDFTDPVSGRKVTLYSNHGYSVIAVEPGKVRLFDVRLKDQMPFWLKDEDINVIVGGAGVDDPWIGVIKKDPD